MWNGEAMVAHGCPQATCKGRPAAALKEGRCKGAREQESLGNNSLFLAWLL
jgi:hypothetical protein